LHGIVNGVSRWFPVNYGRHALSDLLEGSHDLQFYLDAKMNSEWLNDRNHGSASVFDGVDKRGYSYILDYWARHGKVPPLEEFQQNYPAKVLRLEAAEDRLDKAEIVEFAVHEAERLIVAEAAIDVVDLHDEDKIDEAADRIREAARRLDTGLNAPVPDDKAWVANDRPPVPEYPVDQLVGPLRNLVNSSSLPPALLGGAGLAALAGLCANASLRVYGKLMQPILWVPLIAPVSGGKSPSLERAFREFEHLDIETHQHYRTEVGDWDAEGRQKAADDRPEDPTFIIDDITVEQLARSLDEHPNRIAVYDELAQGVKQIGQYKKGSGDRDHYLKLWTGKSWRFNRVTGKIDFWIERPVLSICGCLPEGRLDVLGEADDDGFRSRWLPHLSSVVKPPWRPDRPARRWYRVVRELYANQEYREWELTGSALALWEDASERWGKEISSNETSLTVAALAKADQQVQRIALVIAESTAPGKGGELPAEAMQCAIVLMDYVLDCWRSLESPDVMSFSRRDEALHQGVMTWADISRRAPDGRVRLRELRRQRAGGCRTPEKADDLLRAYRAYYPGSVVEETPPGGGLKVVWVCAPEGGQRP